MELMRIMRKMEILSYIVSGQNHCNVILVRFTLNLLSVKRTMEENIGINIFFFS
jgi:hypothetical protein